MELLTNLVQLVSTQKTQHIDVLGPKQNPQLQVNKLYELIKEGRVKTNEDIIEHFFKDKNHQAKYSSKLKIKLKRKLIKTLFFIDINQHKRSDYDIALFHSYLNFSAIILLKNRGFNNAANELSEEVIKLAIKYDLTDLVYFLSSELSQYYSIFNFSKLKSIKYIEIEKKYRKLFELEKRSKSIFTYFAFFINQNKEYDPNQIPDDILENLEIVKHSLDSINSYYFNFQSRNAFYFKSYLENDFNESTCIAQSAVEFFQTKVGFSKIGEFSFLQKLGIAYQALKRFEEAINVYHDAIKLNPRVGTTAWFNIRNHLFNAHLHLKQYQEAYNYLLEATTTPKFKKLYELYREPWLIKEAYMHFLIKMDKVEESENKNNRLRIFRLNRFLNEVELFSKDKRGLNIAVNIVHALHLFVQKKEDAFERRLDALGQYSFRYLRNDETLRSNAFIKMLQKIPAAGYHPIRLKRYTEKYFKRLIDAPMIIMENSKEVEIIPYEHLWEIVIELLEMRLAKKI